jgi:hypothetical protein
LPDDPIVGDVSGGRMTQMQILAEPLVGVASLHVRAERLALAFER